MSAIAGIWRFDSGPNPARDCDRMLAAQQAYGPHDGRQWSEGPLAMGRRLFRTLPEDLHDRQPLQSRDGRLTLVADVRLDNRDELIAQLSLSSVDAAQLCDAAILLASLERWGEGALDRLVGDFAFVLWDARAEKLLLACDFLGQRPLHYHHGRGFFAFASMPKGLHALVDVPYAVDEQAIAEAVVLMPRGSRSFFKDIARVEPTHLVTITRDGISSRRYWNPQRPGVARMTAEDYVEGLRHHLDQATQSRLRGANGVVGANLSAGLDSGAVAATAARLLAPTGGKVFAFTAVPRENYDGPTPKNQFADEGPLAAATAALHPNIEHVLVRSADTFPIAALDRMFHLNESPVIAMGNLGWALAIAQAARERKIGIVLNGQMGNMTISYTGLELLPDLFRRGRFLALWRAASELVANSNVSWRGVAAKTFGPFAPVGLWQWANRAFIGSDKTVSHYTSLRTERLTELRLDVLAKERHLDFSYRPWKDGFAMRVWVMGRGDNANASKGTLAGWGIDRRDPTADKRLVEYCLSIPNEVYFSDGLPRALAKRALADRLPQAVLNERKRGYQAADWHEGLTAARAAMAAELDRLAVCGPAAKMLDIERLKRLVDDWPTSGWEQDAIILQYRQALLRGISAGHFVRRATGANQ